jgi:hypothetical protein
MSIAEAGFYLFELIFTFFNLFIYIYIYIYLFIIIIYLVTLLRSKDAEKSVVIDSIAEIDVRYIIIQKYFFKLLIYYFIN